MLNLTTAPPGAISFFDVVVDNIDEDEEATCCLSVFISGVARRSFLIKNKIFECLNYTNLSS